MKPAPPKYPTKVEILKLPSYQRKRHYKKLRKYKRMIAKMNKKERGKQ